MLGIIPESSNVTLLCNASVDELSRPAIYKPLSGERPLFDFPPGLYRREILVYELSSYLEIGIVPETVEVNGPYGVGSLQRFIPNDLSSNYFTLSEEESHIPSLRLLCGFDLLINNADRKANHVILGDDGNIYGIDHGLCFHSEEKLRTVMWDFVGEEIPEKIIRGSNLILENVPDFMHLCLSEEEIEATLERAAYIVTAERFPNPPEGRFYYPWPIL